ncbi:transcription termination/antitermination NusG family protein [Phenylobacterium sp.]|uniref:transcription termination/antitermination protein NusG n=1 Tax=Phenylobacterium sp. TaxID=1871053 RepID=UPI0030F4983E
MIEEGRRWYPVQTQPKREAYAVQQLNNQGYEVFFPRRLITVRHARRVLEREASYFPGYIFVSLDLMQEPWTRVNNTFGVRSLVMVGARPAAVPTSFIEVLQRHLDQDGRLPPLAPFQVGERVSIVNGPLVDLVGTIDRLDSGNRVRLLLELATGLLPVFTETKNLSPFPQN